MAELTDDQKQALQQIHDQDNETIDMIRRTRLESKKFVFNQSDTWINNMILICFGLGGALAPIASSITLSGKYQHKLLIWLGIVLLLADGIYLLRRTINKITTDQLGLQAAGLKEEYYLVRRRNTAFQALQGSDGINTFETAANELQGHAGKIAGTRSSGNKIKLNYDNDIATGLLLSGLYFVAFAGIATRLRYILTVYALCLIMYCGISLIESRNVKEILGDADKWNQKIDNEEKRMTKVSQEYMAQD